VKQIRRFNAELAENAEESWDFSSAVFAVSAFNVISEHALEGEITYRVEA
jgi:hypothetical protein